MIFQNSLETILGGGVLFCFLAWFIAALCFFQKILALEMNILNVTKVLLRRSLWEMVAVVTVS